MATSPSRVRRALETVTLAAGAEVRAVAAAAPKNPEEWRAIIFAAAPLVVSEYAPGTAELALNWFEELREDAKPSRAYTPTLSLKVTDEDVAAMVATLTESLRDLEAAIDAGVDELLAELSAELEGAVQRQVAQGFWDTMLDNSQEDPAAVGWQRFARPGACKFCVMLADRGAVYTEATARFAAHGANRGGQCLCLAGPSYDANAPRASAIQYTASRRRISDKQRADLRAYLNKNYPDSPG